MLYDTLLKVLVLEVPATCRRFLPEIYLTLVGDLVFLLFSGIFSEEFLQASTLINHLRVLASNKITNIAKKLITRE